MRMLLAAVAAMLCGLAAPVSAEWREAKTKHFLIYSQDNEAKLHKFAERLEAVHALMLMATGKQDQENPYPVRVYVVADTQVVQSYMEHPDRDVAGFYRPMVTGPVAFTPRDTGSGESSFSPQVVLFHEYAHHFMLQYFPSAYPAWYVEGWAELVSTASFEKTGYVSYGKAAEHRRYELDLSDNLISASRLATTRQKDLNSEERARFYGESWLLAHYLTFDAKRHGQLAAYLAAFNGGASLADAAKVFGDPRTLDRDLDKYLAAANFSYRQPQLPADIGAGIAIRALGPDENAMLPFEMEFTKSMKPDAAKAFAARVETAAAQFPNSAHALALAAEVDLDAGLLDQADRAARRAVALAPNDARARYFLGATELKRAEAADGDKRTTLAAAGKADILAANKLDPDDPLPLIGFYRSFAAAGRAPPEAARNALMAAAQIVPQDGETRLMLVRDLLQRGDKPHAIILLKPLAYDVHGGQGSALALKMLDILEGRATGDPLTVSVDEERKADGAKPKAS